MLNMYMHNLVAFSRVCLTFFMTLIMCKSCRAYHHHHVNSVLIVTTTHHLHWRTGISRFAFALVSQSAGMTASHSVTRWTLFSRVQDSGWQSGFRLTTVLPASNLPRAPQRVPFTCVAASKFYGSARSSAVRHPTWRLQRGTPLRSSSRRAEPGEYRAKPPGGLGKLVTINLPTPV